VNVLVLNAGSSSLKWKLYNIKKQHLIASGLIEGIAEHISATQFTHLSVTHKTAMSIENHHVAFEQLFKTLEEKNILDVHTELSGIGHRVVHGGETFKQPTLITASNIEALKALNPLAPLHNPANILGIEIMMALAPKVPNVAVFDTSFHQSMPEHAYLYALPEHLYKEEQIRRYGFHGTSHHYVAQKVANTLGQPLSTLNLITLHLGNGASACAIKNGKSIDTSMGFTPLEGLVMGTRSGDLDPAIVTYLMEHKSMSSSQINTLLNKESGLKGLCHENDLRQIIKNMQEGDVQAKIALEVFTYRIKKYIGAYVAVLGKVDAIVFTGGIGENAPLVRAMVLEGLDTAFGMHLDTQKNLESQPKAIHQKESSVKIYVQATNEELQIAHETAQLI